MTGNRLRSAMPAILLGIAALVYLALAASRSDVGPVIGAAVFSGPVVLMLLLARIGGSSSQSPLVLMVLLAVSLLAGTGWGCITLAIDFPDPVAGAAATLLPILLAVGALALTKRLGLIDEGLDVLAYSLVVAFGFASALAAVVYGFSMRAGSLDFMDPAVLVGAVLSETAFRPVGTASGAAILALLLRILLAERLLWSSVVVGVSVTAGATAQLAWPGDPATVLLAVAAVISFVATYRAVSRAHPPDSGDAAEADAHAPTDDDCRTGEKATRPGPEETPPKPGSGVVGPRTIERGGVPRPVSWPPHRGRSRVDRGPTPIAVLAAVVVLFLAVQAWGWLDANRPDTRACEPFCGPTPAPPEPPDDLPPKEFVSASGWRVLYSDSDGHPTRNERDLISWEWETVSDGRTVPVEIVFQGSTEASDDAAYCRQLADQNAPGYRAVYQIPNAGLGVYLGSGQVLERSTARPGKAPRREGFFITCVQASDVVVAGWARGLRQPDLAFNANHYDPSYSMAAQALARLSARFEFLDDNGKPIYD